MLKSVAEKPWNTHNDTDHRLAKMAGTSVTQKQQPFECFSAARNRPFLLLKQLDAGENPIGGSLTRRLIAMDQKGGTKRSAGAASTCRLRYIIIRLYIDGDAQSNWETSFRGIWMEPRPRLIGTVELRGYLSCLRCSGMPSRTGSLVFSPTISGMGSSLNHSFNGTLP